MCRAFRGQKATGEFQYVPVSLGSRSHRAWWSLWLSPPKQKGEGRHDVKEHRQRYLPPPTFSRHAADCSPPRALAWQASVDGSMRQNFVREGAIGKGSTPDTPSSLPLFSVWG